jgi:hypothetical protein
VTAGTVRAIVDEVCPCVVDALAAVGEATRRDLEFDVPVFPNTEMAFWWQAGHRELPRTAFDGRPLRGKTARTHAARLEGRRLAVREAIAHLAASGVAEVTGDRVRLTGKPLLYHPVGRGDQSPVEYVPGSSSHDWGAHGASA